MFDSQARKYVGNILIVSYLFRKQCKINVKVTDTVAKKTAAEIASNRKI
jgi:hypothetical protein